MRRTFLAGPDPEILIPNTRDPLYGYTRARITELFREKLAGRVLSAYFFGSFASDSMDRDSDIDLIIVKNTDTPFLERPAEFFDLLDLVPACDIFVYNPEELDKLTKDPSPGFWQDVTKGMKRFV